MRAQGRMAPTAGSSARVVQLDILRGVAISLVVGYHAVFHRPDAPWTQGRWSLLVSMLHYIGPTGVDLFFVLSGFLIGGLLFKELQTRSRLDARRFIIRRGFKIWPSYFAFLAAIFLWRVAIDHEPLAHARVLLPNLLHIQNYLGSPWAPHTWSLAVEEHFYLALPLLLILLVGKRKPPATAIPALVIALGLMIGCAVLRCLAPADTPGEDRPFATHLRVDGLFLGVFLAYLYHFHQQKLGFAARRSVALMGVGLALLVPFPLWLIGNARIAASITLSTLSLGYGCILLAMIFSTTGKGVFGQLLVSPPARALAFVGYFSYPIYLWHMDAMRPVVGLMQGKFFQSLALEPRWLAGTVLYLVGAFAVGAAFGLLLERPSLALRDRLFPARAKELTAAPTP